MSVYRSLGVVKTVSDKAPHVIMVTHGIMPHGIAPN
jgi:hypothetical protein